MTYNITVNEDKTIVCDKDIVVNQFENEIDELVFTFPFDDFGYVAVLKTPMNTKLELPITDNKLTIGSGITSLPGVWSLIIVGSKDDIVFVSNSLALKSCRNHLSLQTTQEIDVNIELLYLELQEKMKVLDTLDLDGLESMSVDIQDIKNISSQILEVVNYNKTMLNNINNNVNNIGNTVGSMNEKLGDSKTGIVHDSYWGLVRTEETKSLAQQLLTFMTDADVLVDEMLEITE